MKKRFDDVKVDKFSENERTQFLCLLLGNEET